VLNSPTGASTTTLVDSRQRVISILSLLIAVCPTPGDPASLGEKASPRRGFFIGKILILFQGFGCTEDGFLSL
jgi:hypothetical protein